MGGVGEVGWRDLAGAAVGDFALVFVVGDFVERLGAFDGGAGDGLVAGGGVFFEIYAGEKGGELEILVLGPAFEGVVVAGVAVEAGGEEEVGGVLHRLGGGAENFVVTRGGVFAVGAGRGEDFLGELIVGRVGGDFLADPVAETFRALFAQELAVHLEEVGPFVGPVVDVVGRADEAVDDGVAFPAGRAGVGEEFADLGGSGREAGEVEIDAAEKLLVGAEAGREYFEALPFGGGEAVDAVPFFRLVPDEAGAVAHDGDGGGGVIALVAGEDGSFAAAERGDEAAAFGEGDVLVAGFDEALGGDVALAAVGVGGEDAHLLLGADGLEDGILGSDFDAGDARGGEVELGAVGDPGAHDAIVFVVEFRALAALVRDGAGGLEQHEGVVGRGEIHAAAGVVVDEGADVKDRVVAAERELEAGLAVLGAVTGAGAATELGEDGIYVADEIDLGVGIVGDDREGGLGGLAGEGGGERGCAVGEGGDLAGGRDRRGGCGDGVGDEAGDVDGVAVGEFGGDEELDGVEAAVESDGGGGDFEGGDFGAGREGFFRGEGRGGGAHRRGGGEGGRGEGGGAEEGG